MPEMKKALIHLLGECKTCGKTWENYLTGQVAAQRHAQKTGHHVIDASELDAVFQAVRAPHCEKGLS